MHMDDYQLEAPKMTYYARAMSNLTGKILTDWQLYDASIWYYGKCNNNGGESEYIIELDIWNNEPAFNAGSYDYYNADAINCALYINQYDYNNADVFKLGEFVYARCYTSNKREEWQPITKSQPLTYIYGNLNNKLVGTIQGKTDHCILQTKIIMPENDILQNNQRYMFNLVFSYDYE